MRKVSENKGFPFLSEDLCYYELVNNDLKDLIRNENLLREAYNRAKNKESKLYIAWHGNYRTDMFELDHLDSFAQAFGFEEQKHIHDIEWKFYDKEEKGAYTSLEINFKCGCTFDGCDGIRKLKKELLLQKGWDMSASYLGGYNSKYIIRVRKNSIK